MTSRSLFLCISCFSSSTILDMASFSVSCSFSDNCHTAGGHRATNHRGAECPLTLNYKTWERLHTKRTLDLNYGEHERTNRSGGGGGGGFSRGTCSPPAPPPAPGRRSWSQRPPAGRPRRTRCPGTPGSAPAACRSPCASVSGGRKHTHRLF